MSSQRWQSANRLLQSWPRSSFRYSKIHRRWVCFEYKRRDRRYLHKHRIQLYRGDKIYLFGFSRGAVIARVVAGLISNAGLLSSWHLDKFPDIWALYKSGGMRDDEFPPEYCEPRAKVEFLGVFDTVYGG